ncbi:hypothetical protein GJ496_004178 [Pomphorhynchus laevis]|nr:hypothetical protein GJ496_004178 [Pomphorhynchus laevis]
MNYQSNVSNVLRKTNHDSRTQLVTMSHESTLVVTHTSTKCFFLCARKTIGACQAWLRSYHTDIRLAAVSSATAYTHTNRPILVKAIEFTALFDTSSTENFMDMNIVNRLKLYITQS